MIEADAFFRAAQARGLDFYCGVPCSFLTPLINRAIGDPATHYVGATSEGEAVGIAAGAWLAGRGTVVMCQNSGLGNTINPITSLNWPFRIPCLLIVTWRGQPGLKDEPQHELMGLKVHRFLEAADVRYADFPTAEADIAPVLDKACGSMRETGLPYALVMAKDSVADQALDQKKRLAGPRGRYADLRDGGPLPRRYDALERLLSLVPNTAAIIATTGKCGRELFTLADRPQHLYQVGSMGCASAMGLGVALNVTRPVIVLDGDGAALMKLGNLATVGAYAPNNLVHVVLDNGTHDSTGEQATVSASVDFAQVALACGYAAAAACDSLSGLDGAIREALRGSGPHLIHLRIAPGSLAKLGRPSVKPHEVALRFKNFLCTAG